MIEDLLKNSLEGLTVIEESSGPVGRLLARQLGGYARSQGKRVSFVSLLTWDSSVEKSAARIPVGQGGGEGSSGIGSAGGPSRGAGLSFMNGGNYDILIVDALSSYLLDRDEREVNETIRHLARLAKQGRNFIITFDGSLLDQRASAHLKAVADSVIVVKTELVGEKVTRALYVPKLKDSRPMDKLVKITVDEKGVEVDTREFVG